MHAHLLIISIKGKEDVNLAREKCPHFDLNLMLLQHYMLFADLKCDLLLSQTHYPVTAGNLIQFHHWDFCL